MDVLKTIVTQSLSVCTTMKPVLFEVMIPTVLTSHSVESRPQSFDGGGTDSVSVKQTQTQGEKQTPADQWDFIMTPFVPPAFQARAQ